MVVVHKAELLALDPDMRAFALVGAFMGHFALLEQGIDTAVGEVVGIAGVKRVIIARNMSFDDKIKTLRTLVNFIVLDTAVAKNFDELAKRARACGEIRNIVAHTPFRRSEISDGVQFFVVKASSKLDIPDMDWSVDEFLQQIDNINDIDNGLRSIESRMSYQRIAEALLGQPDRIAPLSKLGGLFGLGGALLANDDDA